MKADLEPLKGILPEEMALMTLLGKEMTLLEAMALEKRKETPLETLKLTRLGTKGPPLEKENPLKAKKAEIRPDRGMEPPERRAPEHQESLPMRPFRILERLELLSLSTLELALG